jgi:hypothetical protein
VRTVGTSGLQHVCDQPSADGGSRLDAGQRDAHVPAVPIMPYLVLLVLPSIWKVRAAQASNQYQLRDRPRFLNERWPLPVGELT